MERRGPCVCSKHCIKKRVAGFLNILELSVVKRVLVGKVQKFVRARGGIVKWYVCVCVSACAYVHVCIWHNTYKEQEWN